MFIFLPSCEFLHPWHSCSNGWILFFDLALLLVFLFQSPLLLLLAYGLLIASYYGFSTGIPGPELTYQFALGAALGALIVYRYRDASPPLLGGHFWEHIGETARLTLGLVIFTFFFYDIDSLLPENNTPYGLSQATQLVVLWLAIAPFVIFIMLDLKQRTHLQHINYTWKWSAMAGIVFLACCVGFLPSINSYIKAGIAFIAAQPIVWLVPVRRK